MYSHYVELAPATSFAHVTWDKKYANIKSAHTLSVNQISSKSVE